MTTYSTAARRVIDRCLELAQFTEEPGHITRTFLSSPMHQVHALLTQWMEAAGCSVRIDAVGNLIGCYPGSEGAWRRLLIGSHLDTVPHAGAFDGILGVLIGLALVECLGGKPLGAAIEIIGFSEEEGVRFGTPFIGSRALAGTVDCDLLQQISGAIRDYGLDPLRVPEAVLHGDVIGYLEFHIEQGPVLEILNLPLGIVDAIAGQSRYVVEFQGKANHAGTTPMHLRRDAIAAAAEWILTVEEEARNTPGVMATVGKLDVAPAASNIIAGTARATLDVRHAADAVRRSAVERILAAAGQIVSRRFLTYSAEQILEQPAVEMDSCLKSLLDRAVSAIGCPVHRMISGAGHDAMILAQRCPAAMVFLRSPGGVSHHPGENVLEDDVAAALAAGGNFLENYVYG
jgi:allantoate deiminase